MDKFNISYKLEQLLEDFQSDFEPLLTTQIFQEPAIFKYSQFVNK